METEAILNETGLPFGSYTGNAREQSDPGADWQNAPPMISNNLKMSVDALMDQVIAAARGNYDEADIYGGPGSTEPLDTARFGAAGPENKVSTIGQLWVQSLPDPFGG